ncbi:MAG: VOC family protein, partial [Stellaceae bacterium]
MARIRHIALVTDEPAKTAEFYKEHFGLTELYRRPGDTGEHGVWLSDGYIYFAILKYGEPGAPKLGPGQKSDLRGIHHIGFYVDDEQATAKELEAANFTPVPMGKSERDPEAARMTVMGDAQNLKYLGPDAVQLDIRSRG